MDVNMSEVDQVDDVVRQCSGSDSEYFDNVIGHIEEIVMSADFHGFLEKFLNSHYNHFDSQGGNKLQCLNVFQEYSSVFEKYLIRALTKRMDAFYMERFNKELSSRQRSAPDELIPIQPEFYVLLDSHETFKGLMLDYRSQKEGRFSNLQPIIVSKAFLDKFDYPSYKK